MLRISDCVANRAGAAIPQTTEWQHIGNQIDAAFIFAWADFVKVRRTRTIWIVDAHGYGKRFIVHADEKLTAFLELESVIHSRGKLD